MSKQLLSFICFLRASLYGCLAMLIFVQLLTGSDLITALFARSVLTLTFLISILEMIVNVADIPQKLE